MSTRSSSEHKDSLEHKTANSIRSNMVRVFAIYLVAGLALMISTTQAAICHTRVSDMENISNLCNHIHSHGIVSSRSQLCSLKARLEKKQVLVAGFGGSVSQAGHLGGVGFGERFTSWLRIIGYDASFKNFAIGSTGPDYPSLCLHDLLNGSVPDIVLLEFSINLGTNFQLQRLINGCSTLSTPTPIIIYVDTFTQLGNEELCNAYLNGTQKKLPNLQDAEFLDVIKRNNILCVSLGLAFFDAPEYARTYLFERVFWEDKHHLDRAGHDIFSELLAEAVQQALVQTSCKDLRGADLRITNKNIPGICYSYYVRDASVPSIAFNRGNWSVKHLHGFGKIGLRPGRFSRAGSFVAFAVESTQVYNSLGIGGMVNSEAMLNGIVSVSIDGLTVGEFDGFASWPWNIQRIQTYAVPIPSPGMHLIGLTVLNTTSSGGYDFSFTTLALFNDSVALKAHSERCRRRAKSRGLAN